ncbi:MULTISPECIES: T-DNA border endonuclease VirD2 [Rhizobium/Agrobacterium group]|uniref:Endonuclease n=3 Tax=Rhizobium/Agrobacterium group TaxID=227290 RepID=B9K403_ALLAM|nr:MULTISPECIES: T-DNA border endonuclease VirD2 [Rhizobium/Agrobacterium group]ACM39658.1 endonuclease [Allorhizobium ampelinum S4]ASK49693.1 type VI secretion protein [Agrobacterium vitis]MCF1436955.1 type VI secretion protein [Allorhizobium ampelinum]MCF1450623.1 type VI secretion protein [Allorhizobium ampelinum]MCF1496142.1 type VI secretion protein [Allorhizobium ampelinum]
MPDRSQVIIRIVPGGGTKTLQQIINQLEYLSRKGTLELQRSARHLDIFVPPDNIRDLARSWIQETGTYDESQPDEERQKELTTHIIVSFPAGTSQPAAYAASREWAAETFGSGEGGGQYNYLTAFHTDRDHPHLHVVVNRRELLGHKWLKISRRHPQLNYDALRTRMAKVSFRHGIVLEATRRAERGITERPMTFAQYRRLERQQANQIRFDDPDFEHFTPGENDREPEQFFDSSYGERPQNLPESPERNEHLQPMSEGRSRARIGSNGDGRDVEGASGTGLAIESVTHPTSEDDVQQRLHRKRPRGDEDEDRGAKLTRVNRVRAGVAITDVPVTGDGPTSSIQAPGSNPSQTDIATDGLPATADRPQQGGPNSKRPRDEEAEPSIRKRSRDGRSQEDEGNRR